VTCGMKEMGNGEVGFPQVTSLWVTCYLIRCD